MPPHEDVGGDLLGPRAGVDDPSHDPCQPPRSGSGTAGRNGWPAAVVPTGTPGRVQCVHDSRTRRAGRLGTLRRQTIPVGGHAPRRSAASPSRSESCPACPSSRFQLLPLFFSSPGAFSRPAASSAARSSTFPPLRTAIFWPTAEPFRLEKVADGMTPGGYYYAANNFFTSEHGGTHIDAPVHFAQGRQTVDQIPLDRLIGAAFVIDVRGRSASERRLSGDGRGPRAGRERATAGSRSARSC